MTVFARRPPNLPASLLAAAERHPDRAYLVGPDRTVTYREAAETVAALAGRLGTELRQGLALTEPVLVVGDERHLRARLTGPPASRPRPVRPGHAAVLDAAVIGVPHPDLGQAVR